MHKGWIIGPDSRIPLFRRAARAAAPLLAAAMLAAAAACGSDAPTPAADATPAPTPTPAPIGPTAMPDDTGVTPDEVMFGQSAVFSGPSRELGINMRLGIEAAFAEVNRAGGVHGRQLSLVSLDDFYEPEAAVINSRALINDGVFALIGGIGTPTARSVAPLTAALGVPFVAPFTGAAFLRDGSWDNIVNVRASYDLETEEMVDRFTEDFGLERVAVLYQDDSFGRAGYSGVLTALERRGMAPVAVGLYPRNTTAIKTALLDLMQANPEGIIMVGPYDPIGEFILWARELNFDTEFITISFVGSNALLEKLGTDGAGVYVTQVVPFPYPPDAAHDHGSPVPIVNSYLHALEDYRPGSEPGFVSLEGYLAGRLAIAGLERCGEELTRTCFLDNLLNGGDLEIDRFPLSYSEGKQGSQQVFLTTIGEDGLYHPIQRLHEAHEGAHP